MTAIPCPYEAYPTTLSPPTSPLVRREDKNECRGCLSRHGNWHTLGARIVLILLCLVAVGGTVLHIPSRIRPGPPSGGHPPIPPFFAQFHLSLHISYICLFSGPMQSCACRMGTHARLDCFAGRSRYCVVAGVAVVVVAAAVPTLLSFSRRFFLPFPSSSLSMSHVPSPPCPWSLALALAHVRHTQPMQRGTVTLDCRLSTFDLRLSAVDHAPMTHGPRSVGRGLHVLP